MDSIGSGCCAAAAFALRIEALFHAARPPPVTSSVTSRMVDPVKPRVVVLKGLRIRDDLLAVGPTRRTSLSISACCLLSNEWKRIRHHRAPVSRQWRLL